MKSGWKTSEFWLRLLGKALGAGTAAVGMLQPSPTTQAAGAIMGGLLMLLSQFGYSAERTELKKEALRAEIKPKPLDPSQVP